MAKNTTRFDSIDEIFNRLFDIENNRIDLITPKESKIPKFTIHEIINRCYDPNSNTLDVLTSDPVGDDTENAIRYAIIFGI